MKDKFIDNIIFGIGFYIGYGIAHEVEQLIRDKITMSKKCERCKNFNDEPNTQKIGF